MQIGDYSCESVEMGRFALDGGAMFGVVPKPLWERKITPDAANRIPMSTRALLIRGRGRVILVDTGLGTKLSDKTRRIYKIDESPPDPDRALAPLTREDVTDVILSHLHFDHCGGGTLRTGDQVVPAFPNAVYHVQEAQWAAALHPTLRDTASYMPENFLPLEAAGQLRIHRGPGELYPGIHLRVTNGHTSGQHHPLVLGSRPLFFCGDLIPTSAHLPIPWHMAYDNDPLTLLGEKAAILREALDGGWILFFPHDPETAAVSLRRGEKGPDADETFRDLTEISQSNS